MSDKNKDFDKMFDEMLEAQCEQMAKDNGTYEEFKATTEEEEKQKKATVGVLKQFLSYIKSIRFKNICKSMGKKLKLNHKIVKNLFIENMLRKIADVLHLAITITAEVIQCVNEFIFCIINRINYFCKDVCLRIVKLFTLNCGSYGFDDDVLEG